MASLWRCSLGDNPLEISVEQGRGVAHGNNIKVHTTNKVLQSGKWSDFRTYWDITPTWTFEAWFVFIFFNRKIWGKWSSNCHLTERRNLQWSCCEYRCFMMQELPVEYSMGKFKESPRMFSLSRLYENLIRTGMTWCHSQVSLFGS